ncbi:hypothetical protein [Streptomyces sp. NPDC048565]|uniref:hypothetical protein n=1 Tax=Streptomyces sp. NPDC048565 TaxID=3155266 RepID=UPI003428DC28
MDIVKRTHEIAETGDTRGALALIQVEAAAAHGRFLRALSVISIEGPSSVTTAAEAIGDRVHIWMEMRLRIAGISRQSLGASGYASIETGFQNRLPYVQGSLEPSARRRGRLDWLTLERP